MATLIDDQAGLSASYPTTGLTAAEVAARQEDGRTNATEKVTSRPLWAIIKANVFTRFNALLGALFIMVVATGSYIDGLFGLALILNSLFGIGQEWYAKHKLDSLALMHAPTATVIRDGRESVIPVEQIVADDLIILKPGDQVPADGPLLWVDSLEIDESNLTGESDAIDKRSGDQVSSGTVVVAGTGQLRAAVVGAATTVHQLASQAKVFTRAYSEVQASTNRLLRIITWVVLVMFPVAIIAQMRAMDAFSWAGFTDNWRAIILRSSAGLVALVPEGLVLLTTLAFLLAALQLTRQQALIQELPAVEGLARVDVICLDKTGTLTAGQIVMERLTVFDPSDDASARDGLGALVHDPTPNPTAQAIAAQIGPSTQAVTARVPFSSARKYSGVTLADGSHWLLGAPEIVAAGQTELLDRVAPLAADGIRVVVLAKADALEGWTEIDPVGLVELTEQIRPDAADTLAYFRSQDVAVKVISGDNPVTVAAVARRVGLVEANDPSRVVDARTLPDTVAELQPLVETIAVFGRVTPEKKRLIVQALQAQGHTVAMTGDGVNDVLALKDADIGIAMGNGAQATKAVAQIVLLDSSFAHMPMVLAEGRRLIGNVERVAALFVSKNVMATCLLIATAVVSMTFPFLPRHMTLLSMLTIGIPAAVLALGPNKRRYRPGFLTRVLMIALPAGLAAGLATFGAFSWSGGGAVEASSVGLTVLFIVNFWLLGVLARPLNWWKILTIAVMVALAALAFIWPTARDFLQLDLPANQVGLVLGLGLAG
ncbi:MAG: HAD-IC family P-type ATPase, partial [Propionibacteriaceae bacterium]|nr:HAD-IC family P-type ATPase [Propionibacteriaceae bacterium]